MRHSRRPGGRAGTGRTVVPVARRHRREGLLPGTFSRGLEKFQQDVLGDVLGLAGQAGRTVASYGRHHTPSEELEFRVFEFVVRRAVGGAPYTRAVVTISTHVVNLPEIDGGEKVVLVAFPTNCHQIPR